MEPLTSSKIKTYLICPFKFRCLYIENLQRPEIEKNCNFLVFNYVHKIIGDYLSNKNDISNFNIYISEKLDKYLLNQTLINYNNYNRIIYEIKKQLDNFNEMFVLNGFSKYINYYFKFKLNDIYFSGFIDLLIEKVREHYELYFFKTGNIPDNETEIINDYQIILSLIYLESKCNIIPDKVKIFFLKHKKVYEIEYLKIHIEQYKNEITEISKKILSDTNFEARKNDFCLFCDYRILCPYFQLDINNYQQYMEMRYNYFRLLENIRILNDFTFSLKNLFIAFNNILQNIEKYKEIKYKIFDGKILKLLNEIILDEQKSKEEYELKSNEIIEINNDEEFIYKIRLNEEIIGCIIIKSKVKKYSENDITFLSILCNHFNSIFQNAYFYNKSIKDELTQLYNNSYYRYVLEKEKKLAIEYDKRIGLIIIDIDFFKKINDTYGHKIGDLVLKEVADEIKNSVSETELVFRYGGEEFVIIISEKNLKEVIEIAEKIRKNIEEKEIQIDENRKIKVTISSGISVYKENTENIDDLFIVADKKLYKAKKEGRNRVTY